MATRHVYAAGYATRSAAYEALSALYADGEVSEAEAPAVESYTTTRKERLNAFNVVEHRVTRYRITLEG